MPGTKRFLQPIRSILESAKSGILIVKADGKVFFMNDSLEQQSGIKFNGLRGKGLNQLFPAGRMAELIRLTEGRQLPKRLRMKMNTASGERVVSVFVSRIMEHTKLDGLLLVIQSDTQEKPNGDFEKNRNSILRVMDRRVDEACSITDILTGEDLFMSSSIVQLTGWEADDFHKGGFGFGMSLIHPDDVGGVMNIFEQEIEKRNREPFLHDHLVWQASFRYRTADGKYIRIRTETLILERNENMAVRLVMSTFRKYETDQRKSQSIAGTNSGESIRIIDGKPYINIEFLNRLRSQTGSQGDVESTLPELTDRELQILQLLSVGNSSQKIAKQLNISTHTVSTHRKQLLRKLGAQNGADLIRRAQKLGILT
jgi:PAS domain S-box-containing protein